MEPHRLLWGVVAFMGMLCTMIGMSIGLIRYNRDNNRIREEVKNEYQAAQKAGGIKSLYYKHEHKRVFAKTFGMPILIGFLTGMILMLIAFHNL